MAGKDLFVIQAGFCLHTEALSVSASYCATFKDQKSLETPK